MSFSGRGLFLPCEGFCLRETDGLRRDGWTDRGMGWIAALANRTQKSPSFLRKQPRGPLLPLKTREWKQRRKGTSNMGQRGYPSREKTPVPKVSPSLLGWVSRPRLQAPSQGAGAIGFSPGAARDRGGTQQVPPPSELAESPCWALLPEYVRMEAAGRRRGTIAAPRPWLHRPGL